MLRGVQQFGRFLGVGVVNALLGLLVIYAAKWFFGASDIGANLIGYGVGMTVSFVLNSRWTFSFQGSNWLAFVKFIAFSMLGYAGNLAAVLFAIRTLGIDSYLAQAIGIPVYTLIVYTASKHLVFRADTGTSLRP